MFWSLYFLSVILFSFSIGIFFKGRRKFFLIFTSLVVLLTPAQIDVSSNDYAPAIFTFIFNSLLEQNYSLRVLRPLVISLPISLSLLGLFIVFKKRFS